MPRRIGRKRPVAARVAAAPVLGVAVLAILPAVAKPPTIPTDRLPYLALFAYLFNLVVLIVFGIWGFRIGSGGRDDGNGGGGPEGPEVKPPPPPGGLELSDDFHAWEQQLSGPQHEPAEEDRPDKVSSGPP